MNDLNRLLRTPGGRTAHKAIWQSGADPAGVGSCTSAVRRFAGPVADELTILCRPGPAVRETHRQAEAVYRALATNLASQRASCAHLVSETLFLRPTGDDLARLLDVRARLLAALGPDGATPVPACIRQAPLTEGASFELLATALVPRDRNAWSVQDVQAASPCTCAACARSGGRLVCLGGQTALSTTNLYGAGGDAFRQAWEAFCMAERLLHECGMDFRDVVRTWIHLRDIDRDYEALNRARRQFFRERGIAPPPASTGVQGAPVPDAHDVSLSLQALKSPHPSTVTPMATPLLNEAWTYGVDFSRGLRVADANKVTLHVSGTASIDEHGDTVHVGDVEAQAGRMLDNIASLLARQGAGFVNLMSAVVYVKNEADAPVLRAVCAQRGFAGFPCAFVQARLCRPDLLCEAEAVAMLPLPRPAA